MRLVFLASPFQNAFFHEVRTALIEAVEANGVDAIECFEPDQHEVGDNDVFVLGPPHEWVTLEGSAFVDDPAVAARTIGVSAEQPNQVFFDRNVEIGAKLGAVLDFSQRAVDAYRKRGIDADLLPFGYVPGWDRTALRSRGGIDYEVVYLGNKAPRRLSVLASAATELSDLGARLVISDNAEPNTASSPSFLAGDDKRNLLAHSGVLINIHQSSEPYFEWLRFADATHCGTPVITEASAATAPFRPGEHFTEFAAADLGSVLRNLPSQDRLDATAAAALDVLRGRPLSKGVIALIDAAVRVLAVSKPPSALPARTRHQALGRERADPTPVAGWPPRRAKLRNFTTKIAGIGPQTVAPGDVAWRGTPPRVPRAAGFVSAMVDGVDADGQPALEGLWPWEPWRLTEGQHLGRVLLVDNVVAAAAAQWCTEAWAEQHPHVVIQLFCAVHGIRGAHVARPSACLDGVPIDSSHSMPPDVAERARSILAGAAD